MRRHGIRALTGRHFRPHTTDSRRFLPVAPNLVAQRFVAPAPDRIWLADITDIATGDGWLYLAAILDLSTLKVELVRQRRWGTHDEARCDLFAYIEAYYNRQRIHSAIGISPRNRPGRKRDNPCP